MTYQFEISTDSNCLGYVDVDLNDDEVQVIKDMIKEYGGFDLGNLEMIDSGLYNKILNPCNDLAEEGIKQIHKEFAESCDEEFDEENYEVDWANEDVEVYCPSEFFEEDDND